MKVVVDRRSWWTEGRVVVVGRVHHGKGMFTLVYLHAASCGPCRATKAVVCVCVPLCVCAPHCSCAPWNVPLCVCAPHCSTPNSLPYISLPRPLAILTVPRARHPPSPCPRALHELRRRRRRYPPCVLGSSRPPYSMFYVPFSAPFSLLLLPFSPSPLSLSRAARKMNRVQFVNTNFASQDVIQRKFDQFLSDLA